MNEMSSLLRDGVWVCLLVVGITLLRGMRGGRGRGYVALLGAVMVVGFWSVSEQHVQGAVVVLGSTLLFVAAPAVLEAWARAAFVRGQLAWAYRLSVWRLYLMPLSGTVRQLELLRGVQLLQHKGVDVALAHYQRLVSETEDPGEAALIEEQIVSTLFYAQKWHEGVARFEQRFALRYATVRPALALGLLRAYGELGQLGRAADLLRLLEDGPLGKDGRSLSFLGQARLTFLAYAGATEPVKEALSPKGTRALGLSHAAAAWLRAAGLRPT